MEPWRGEGESVLSLSRAPSHTLSLTLSMVEETMGDRKGDVMCD